MVLKEFLHLKFFVMPQYRLTKKSLNNVSRLFDICISATLSKEYLENVLKKSPVHLREFVKEFIELGHKQNVPLLIVSAGIKQFIESILLKELNCFPEIIKIISNELSFNTEGICDGSLKPLIVPFNKLSSVKNHMTKNINESIKCRTNVLLVGDAIEDASLDDIIENKQETLKIGFFNNNNERHLDSFMNSFDIRHSEAFGSNQKSSKALGGAWKRSEEFRVTRKRLEELVNTRKHLEELGSAQKNSEALGALFQKTSIVDL
uniref:5'-nucleotidase n=1 Tax=Acrobeloides nanus TaxID=290746 RepID=A0A914C928_9BILA